MTERRTVLGAAAVLAAAGAVLGGVVLTSSGGTVSAAPTTVGPEWRSFRADVTGVRPGPDERSLLVQVALPGKDPGCVREPHLEQVVEAKADIRADVVYSTRPAAGGCEATVAAELRLTVDAPVADRTVIFNADPANAWHRLGAGWGRCDTRAGCTPPPDHCAPAWQGAAASASGATAKTDRGCDPDWLVLDLKVADAPVRTAYRWAEAGWTSFAQAKSGGCAEIRAVEPKFPAALCRHLPAPA